MLSPLQLVSAAAQDLVGISRWEEFTPIFTGLTVVGGLTAKGYRHLAGRVLFFQVQFQASTSLASTAGTSYCQLPQKGQYVGGAAVMSNGTTKSAVGNCHIDIANGRVYLPTQTASGNVFTLAGFYGV